MSYSISKRWLLSAATIYQKKKCPVNIATYRAEIYFAGSLFQ